MFDPDPLTRINFHDIRSHPVFDGYFVENGPQSQFLYKGKAGQNKSKPGRSEAINISNNFAKEKKIVDEIKGKSDFFKNSQ
jgi:hypothetical protein